MEEKEIKRGKNGLPIPGPGRPEGLKNDPIKKARKQLIEEYKDALAEALPDINPVLVAKAVGGDIQAIKEVNDVIVEKATRNTDITTGGKPFPLLGGQSKNGKNNNSDSEVAEIEEED